MSDIRILEQVETDEKEIPPQSSRWLTWTIEVVIILLAVALIFIVRQSWLEPAEVTSSSMENTLKKGDRFLVDHRKALSGTWKRGDIVLVYTENGGWGEDTVVKRVIGLPGETVEILNGQVYINGKALAEDYLKERPRPQDTPRITLGAGEYYILGDNRNRSGDSREFGPVTNDEIRGRAVRRIWPMGGFEKPNYAD